MLAPQERKEIVRKLPALASAHGVSKCRDDASKDAVLRMVAALRQKALGAMGATAEKIGCPGCFAERRQGALEYRGPQHVRPGMVSKQQVRLNQYIEPQ